MPNDLEKRLTRLEDITEIQQLLNRYVYMLVTMDFEHIYDECFSQTREDVSIQASDSGVYIVSTLKSAFSANLWSSSKPCPARSRCT